MPSPDADRLLIARIRAGDQEAWSECIARFEGRLLAFVNSRLGDSATSEDVVQETFLDSWWASPITMTRRPPRRFCFDRRP